jgi:hypothetical protein
MAGINITEGVDDIGVLKDKAHTVQHSVTDTACHTFPGGTANFMRADGAFAEPPAGTGSGMTQAEHDALPNPHHSNSYDHAPGSDNQDLSGKSDVGHTHSYEPADTAIQSHVISTHAPSNAQANADITKAEIEAKLTGELTSHTHASGGGGGTWVTSGTVVMTGSALTDITGFVQACATASKYKFEVDISNSCSLTAGVKYGFGYTGSNATVEAQIYGKTAATIAAGCAMTAFATKSPFTFNRVAATGCVTITGIVQTAGTVGNFSIMHCSGSATGTITCRGNSVFEWVKIA